MEKVRYVKFDAVGHILVTGIANLGPLHQDRLHADRLPPVYNRPASFSNLGPPGPTESRIIASYEERRDGTEQNQNTTSERRFLFMKLYSPEWPSVN